jgi:GNAT superfamily N-acetyltransferase
MRKLKVKAERGAFRVRQATLKDVLTIARLIRGLAKYEKLEHVCHASPHRLQRHGFARGLQRYFEALIVEQDGDPVGFALYLFMYSTFRCSPILYIEDLFVIPKARARGAGKALLAALARVALKHGCGQMKWSVLDWNEPAFRFYRTLGAKAQKEWVWMRLEKPDVRRLARHA